jgi:glycosyltransferase involved in cell wall biosynthesis
MSLPNPPPLVSVILTTRDRPRLLPVALECYRHQSYGNRELIVVDDGDRHPVDRRIVEELGGRLIHVAAGTKLGTKLNCGVEQAKGSWCQKMDDDDWYAPCFIEGMMAAVYQDRKDVCRPVVAILSPFLFFEVARWEVRRSGRNNAPGATLLFAREDWEQRPFRALPRDEDVWFIRDQQQAGATVLPVKAVESFMAVRHRGSPQDRGHTWTHQGNGSILEDGLQERSIHRTPDELLPEWALAVYRPLHRELSATCVQ